MARSRKQIAFDLDTNMLKNYYPKVGWQHAYDDIKRHMQNNGFEWQQGSVYVSLKPMDLVILDTVVTSVCINNPWLNVCMRDCVVMNIGKEHSLNHFFDKTANVPKREKS
jgi:virulence-associated protein VapD